MTTRPYSVRDLRSVFHTDSMRRDYFGDYDAASRRWRFTSAQSAHEAGSFLASTGPLITLHDHDAVRHVDAIRVRGGFSVVARNENCANKHGTAFYLFKSEDERFSAERYLYSHTRASSDLIREALANLRDVPDGVFSEPASAIRERIESEQPSTREMRTVIARATAARGSRAPSESARSTDRAEVLERARAFNADFTDVPAVRDGRVIGLLAAKSEHHIAVQVERSGVGMVFERDTIELPLTQQYTRERAFDAWCVIGIDLEDGRGRALQIKGEQDFDFGSMRMAGALAARDLGLLPILQDEELSSKEDLVGTIVGADDQLAVSLDAGAYAVIGMREKMPGAIGDTIRQGPSFAATRALSRGRA